MALLHCNMTRMLSSSSTGKTLLRAIDEPQGQRGSEFHRLNARCKGRDRAAPALRFLTSDASSFKSTWKV